MNMFSYIKRHSITFVILLSISYWIYLLFTSSMGISADAIGYESLGRTIFKGGWIEYFRTGPNREPLYPFIISISMHIADFLAISYAKIQTIFQIIILLSTQLLTLTLLRKLNTSKTISVFILLFVGFSPAIVNSAFSLFSEIVTYPIILGILICLSSAWKTAQNDSTAKCGAMGILLGLLFIFAISAKAVFIYILPVCLLPFFVLSIHSILKKNSKTVANTIVIILAASLSAHTFVSFIKDTNLKYNGSHQFTNRGAWYLYGGTAVRTNEKLTPKAFLTALATVPGEKVCRSLFKSEECDYFSPYSADGLGSKKNGELIRQGLKSTELDSTLIKLSTQQIFKRPFQYTILYLMETLRMFFWESTQIGFVVYPDILTKIFAFTPFKNGIRLLVSLISIVSFIYVTGYIIKRRSALLPINPNNNAEAVLLGFFMLIICLGFIGIYALFITVPRYSLPIAPIFILCSAIMFQRWFYKERI